MRLLKVQIDFMIKILVLLWNIIEIKSITQLDYLRLRTIKTKTEILEHLQEPNQVHLAQIVY